MFDQDIGLLPVTWRDEPVLKRGGSPVFWTCKRAFDIAFSAVVLLPVLALFAIALFLLNPFFNPGPVFTTQTRIGKDGKEFRLWKFRTMTGRDGGSRFATEERDRIKPLGRWLRRRRIDELPQILNVLSGDMSIVGPRPERPSFVKSYELAIPRYSERHTVRPGITGLAQVEYGYTSDLMGTTGKLRYDLTYIRKSGFRMEGWLVWRTIVVMLNGFGAE